MYISNVLRSSNLEENSVVKEYLITAFDCKYNVTFYSFYMILAEYETLIRRIRLNEQIIQNLETTAQTFYRKMFVDNIDKEKFA